MIRDRGSTRNDKDMVEDMSERHATPDESESTREATSSIRTNARPLIWVVTPVYNGERYLAECIESVLAQTYGEWRYLVVDNRSTDRTAEIAGRYTASDPRISMSQNEQFLPVIENWNHALRALPNDAAYCKVVHADDVIYPECLERMIAVAEKYSQVGLVSSYVKHGAEIRQTEGVPRSSEIISGREICRATLEDKRFVFGSPTSLLMRADLVRAREYFYNEENIHADTEACFDVLRTTDLGFVHDVLSHTRLHDAAITPGLLKINTYALGWLIILIKYGSYYLERNAYMRRLALAVWRYVWFLGKATLRGKL
ncbi:MAG: glycosyltransferase family 2 protein, partial [Gemmatimonadaceae bacterium]|nr:glycosyltransferase family 2 protein [Gemmatimonadaceae bacterium]